MTVWPEKRESSFHNCIRTDPFASATSRSKLPHLRPCTALRPSRGPFGRPERAIGAPKRAIGGPGEPEWRSLAGRQVTGAIYPPKETSGTTQVRVATLGWTHQTTKPPVYTLAYTPVKIEETTLRKCLKEWYPGQDSNLGPID